MVKSNFAPKEIFYDVILTIHSVFDQITDCDASSRQN